MKKLTILFLVFLFFGCDRTETVKVDMIDQQLVYISSRGNGFDLYKCDQDGTKEVQLTTQPGWDWGPRWWPAEMAILHYAQDTAGNFSHKLIDFDGQPIEMDFQGLSDFIPAPYKMSYALYTEKVGENSHVFLQDLSTRTATDITPGDAYYGRPQWSIDGKSILMISDISGSQELHLYSMEDQSLVQLTDGEGRAKYASWSPDGKQIAFTREVLEEPKKDHDIYILNIETKDVTQLTDTPFGEQEISWSPMGDKIAYHGTIDGKDDIYTIDIETKEVVKITKGQGYHGEPVWIPIFETPKIY